MQLIVLSEIKYRFRLEQILQLDPLLSVQATQTIPDSGIRDKFQLLALWQLNPITLPGRLYFKVEGRAREEKDCVLFCGQNEKENAEPTCSQKIDSNYCLHINVLV
jgi:hypothetical protein